MGLKSKGQFVEDVPVLEVCGAARQVLDEALIANCVLADLTL
jgi:hypothetical protein